MVTAAPSPAALNEVLDDLCSRFVINIPEHELSDPIRVCFALEQAHWFYLDFYREQNEDLPHLNLNAFITTFFQHWGPFNKWVGSANQILGDWKRYKKSVPVCGAIILNPNCSKVLLVKSWGKNGIWGFPKGKINKQESNLTCAIREVREETGYDISALARSDAHIQAVFGDQENTLFIVIGVPESTHFEPLVRKEISDIKFHKLSNLTGKGKMKEPTHIMVEATIIELRKWLKGDLGQRLRKEAMAKAESKSIFSSEDLQGAAKIADANANASADGTNALLALLHGATVEPKPLNGLLPTPAPTTTGPGPGLGFNASLPLLPTPQVLPKSKGPSRENSNALRSMSAPHDTESQGQIATKTSNMHLFEFDVPAVMRPFYCIGVSEIHS